MSANESDEPKNGGKNNVGNRTMQLDAFVDEMEDTTGEEVGGDAVLAEILAERDAEVVSGGTGGAMDAPIVSASMAPAVSRPPPLPPKRIPKWAYIVGISFVVLAVVLGVVVGQMFTPEPAATVTPPDATEPTEETGEGEGAEPEFVPLDLETVIVSGEEGEEGEGDVVPEDDEANAGAAGDTPPE